ncbi:hypothetical protein K458DRAFT_418122 [Lentithecium fluviatile CBS 122367]|uniref:Uncharacterized protein n=1 Tax=Lentithecium fluviatile CBS 122367 TaxID=1168545 RepID=A0A6G1J206_9PLEO|nr:hypothetical protein K458DRAFT_418122 [Lentithecium fluviatile CBS 122367]
MPLWSVWALSRTAPSYRTPILSFQSTASFAGTGVFASAIPNASNVFATLFPGPRPYISNRQSSDQGAPFQHLQV